MSELLKVWLVKCKCACSAWFPLSQLHFCRKCAQLRCPVCVIEEIDSIFCPNCLENTASTDAVQRRFRCNACHECPMCTNLLGIRSQADLYYLHCNACQWSSRDLGMPDHRTSNEPWPEPANPLGEELAKVMNIMKGLSNYERIERERKAQTTKRLSNLGILHNDRFALQNAYNMRKKALNLRPESVEELGLLTSSADVPELEPTYLTELPEPGNTLGLAQIILHPITGAQAQMYPAKLKMISRRALRCLDCETMLYKAELSPNVVKPRLQSFALDYFPEFHISRQVQLIPGQNSTFFLTVTNNSAHQMEVKLAGCLCDDPGCVDTSMFSVDLVVPNKDSSSEMQALECLPDPTEITSKVIYVRRNRAGICVDCRPPAADDSRNNFALFNLTTALQLEPRQLWTTQLRIDLSDAAASN